MSHTTQRRGLDPSRPGEEMVMLAMIPRSHRGKEGPQKAMRELAVKMLEHGRDHWPPWTIERLEAATKEELRSTLAVAFTDLERVEKLLNDVRGDWLTRNREKGYPVSIVITGLTRDIHGCCQKAGLKQHTYLHSLGFFGRGVKDLPSGDELSLITMCGHGLIARNRIRHLVRSIQDGELTPEEAADDIALPCQCGIGNKPRAEKLFRRLAAV